MFIRWVEIIAAPLGVIGSTLRDYVRLDRYIGAVLIVFAVLFVPLIPVGTDNPQMLATVSNDDPWMAMALEATLAKPFGNPSNYFDLKSKAYNNIPPYWGHLRSGYENIVYYGGSVFALATPVYAAARLAGLPPFPTAPLILKSISFVAALLSLVLLYNFASRFGMRLAGVLAVIYLMTDTQFGWFTKVSHPDTLQLLLALAALAIAVRHAERGDWPSLAALGLMCGFVQGAKVGGPWTVPMGLLALWWGVQATGHRLSDLTILAKRVALLGSTALLGYVVSTPYAFMDPYLFRGFFSAWQLQGLGAAADGPFGRVTMWTWIDAIYAHVGPLATILVVAALARIIIGAVEPRNKRAIALAAVLSVSQLLWYGGFGRLWIIVGYLLVAFGLLAVLALDTAIVVLQRLAKLALAWLPSGKLVGARVAAAMVISLALLLGAPRVLQSATSTLLSASFKNSTSAAVNDWAIRSGLPREARILYDDSAYFDPTLFPNAVLFGSPLHWDAVDEKAPDYIVLSSSIYKAPHYRAVLEHQKLGRDDLEDGATGAYSIRLYQDLLPYERFGPTELPGIEYVTEIKPVKIPFNEPAWLPPWQSPVIRWALIPVWQVKYWLQKSFALIPAVIGPGRPVEGPTFRIFRVTVLEDGRRPRFACTESVTTCTDFKQRVTHTAGDRILTRDAFEGNPVTVVFDANTCARRELGNLDCGVEYEARYEREANRWTVTGLNKSSGEVVTFSAENADPRPGSISIWGMINSFNDNGDLKYLGNKVGRVVPGGRTARKQASAALIGPVHQTLRRRAFAGEPVMVVFDVEACNQHELGNLHCGVEYEARYEREANRWTVTGLGKSSGEVVTFSTQNADPRPGLISMWGMINSFNDQGDLKYLGHKVGRVSLVSQR